MSWFKSHISLWVLSASRHSVIWLVGVCEALLVVVFHLRNYFFIVVDVGRCQERGGTWKLSHVRFSNQGVKFLISVLQSILSQTNPDLRFSCNNPFISSHHLLTIHVPVPRMWCVLGVFVKLQKVTVSCITTYCPLHGTARLSLDGIPWNLVFEYFLKISQENSSFINARQG